MLRPSKNRHIAFTLSTTRSARKDILSQAWRLVRVNRGSPGVDGISFEAIEKGIEKGIGVETFLVEKLPTTADWKSAHASV